MKNKKPMFAFFGNEILSTDQSRSQKLWWGFFKSAVKNKHYHLAFNYFFTWLSLV